MCFISDLDALPGNELQVLISQEEISGEEIGFILNNYPPQTPVSVLLQEENPGSLPFVRREREWEREQEQERERDFEYTAIPQSISEA